MDRGRILVLQSTRVRSYKKWMGLHNQFLWYVNRSFGSGGGLT